jgi:hypothetical protein
MNSANNSSSGVLASSALAHLIQASKRVSVRIWARVLCASGRMGISASGKKSPDRDLCSKQTLVASCHSHTLGFGESDIVQGMLQHVCRYSSRGFVGNFLQGQGAASDPGCVKTRMRMIAGQIIRETGPRTSR